MTDFYIVTDGISEQIKQRAEEVGAKGVIDKASPRTAYTNILDAAGYPKGDENRRVLHVDDDQLFRSRMKRVIEDAGYTIDSCGTPESALDAYNPKKHGFVFTDLQMPDMDGDMDGFELIQGMKILDVN